MSNIKQDSSLAELLHQLADVWQDFADLCEERADQITKEISKTSPK